MSDFQDTLKVGDRVVLTRPVLSGHGLPYKIAEIQKVTHTYFLIEGYKYSRSEKCFTGDITGCKYRAMEEYTDEYKRELKTDTMRRIEAKEIIKNLNLNNLTTEALEKIVDLLSEIQ